MTARKPAMRKPVPAKSDVDSASDSSSVERERIAQCIAGAEADAGDDDANFVQLLERRLQGSPVLRSRSVIPVFPEPSPQRSFQVHSDPRYLANTRLLARRTGGGLRVIGGEIVPPGDFMDCVAVGNAQQWGCTGTLIAANVVVTAGHCANFATRIFIGRDVSKKGKSVHVVKRVPHPDYNHQGHNDLMVLLLAEPVVGVVPRTLATKTLIDKASDGRVVGFGATDATGMLGYGVKRYVDVPIVSNACKGKLGTQQDRYMYGCDLGQELVAGRPLTERDSCKGDSGGPFYVLDAKGQWRLAGATSRATNSAMSNCGDGGIYVRIDRYRAWIASIPGVVLP